MAVKKRGKKRNRRSFGPEPRATRNTPGEVTPGPTWAKARTKQSHQARPKPGFMDGEQRQSLMRLLAVVMVPGRAFFAMERPIPGVVCLGLQASLVGWVPAAVWAAWATRRVRQKQRALAVRLRPG